MDEMIALTFKSEEDALAAMERLVAAGICDVALRPPAGSTWVLSIHTSGAHDQARLRELACQSARLTTTWRSMMAQYVPMAVAAATTFHRVHRTTKAIRDRRDYDDALNIAAGALATLAPVYTVHPLTQQRIEVRVDRAIHRFAAGARQLRSLKGEIFEPLFIQRADLLRAISLIGRAGLPFSFAVVPAEGQALGIGHGASQDGAGQ